MADGFRVDGSALRAGQGAVDGLTSQLQQTGSGVLEALSAAAGAVGHPGLAATVAGTSGRAMKAFLDGGATLAHVSSGLGATAGEYESADSASASRFAADGRAR